MKYVRFHGILDDENGVYTEDEHGQPQYNFTYVDEIYDGLLARGVRPVVEISFMPKLLAAHPAPHAFWYKPNVAPPKRLRALGRADPRPRARTWSTRYGIDEVAQWYFEVWNEPNIDFWVGEPEAGHLLRALQPHRARAEVGEPAAARRWPGHGRRGVGARVPEVHARQRRAGGLPLHPRLRRRKLRAHLHCERHCRPWTTASAPPWRT